MAIEWTAPPALKAEIRRGKPWSYHLPVRDAAADVTWHCRVLPLSALEAEPASPARITVTVPADLDILFAELNWQVSSPGTPLETGRIVFRVLEPLAPTTPTPPTETVPVSASRRRAAASLSSVESIAIAGNASASLAGTATMIPSPPSSDARTMPRVIEVIRGGATVPGLRAEVREGRTVTIGRGTRLADHDLDLTGRFEREDLEIYCSRKQAAVFCNDDGVFIRCLGQRPLRIVDADDDVGRDVVGDYCWQVGQILGLPGKLHIVLREGPR
jgi:hypothetical protein